MSHRTKHGVPLVLFLALLTHAATAQVMSIPSSAFGNIGSAGVSGPPVGIGALSSEAMTNNLWDLKNAPNLHSPLQNPAGSVSSLDLKAPGKARKEFAKGYQLLMRKDYKAAIEHLTVAISAYPQFVAAYNALGSAYLALGQNVEARGQFAKAVALDDHMPASYLNLGCAQLALKDFHAAEESVQKAAAIAPVDLQLATALTYTQFMNQDYGGVLETARRVHSGKHPGASVVHFFAAAALDEQGRLQEAQSELQTLLLEDPKSPSAEQARNLLVQVKVELAQRATHQSVALSVARVSDTEPTSSGPTPEQVSAQRQLDLQDAQETKQIEEAEAGPELSSGNTGSAPSSAGPVTASLNPPRTTPVRSPYTLRTVVDEVAVFFAATDHGKSVTDLTREDIGIRDDQKSPSIVTGFRNQTQLPLRLGIVIDTSESVESRFAFERRSAIDFLQKTLTDKNDLAFVVGVANSVLLVQDFTADQQKMSEGINHLAPSGGTALWDAVAFAADKLAAREESQPVARMLVVISDGKDNSSATTLKEAIARATRGEVFVYTVSTREANDVFDDHTLTTDGYPVGDRALKVLADNTGGAAFVPGSIRGLNKGLDELQEVIRSRYLISYKPAMFKHNGHYRSIDISAQKSGRKLRIYARKGYYAGPPPANEASQSR